VVVPSFGRQAIAPLIACTDHYPTIAPFQVIGLASTKMHGRGLRIVKADVLFCSGNASTYVLPEANEKTIPLEHNFSWYLYAMCAQHQLVI
jgi:hypothetical protein